MKITDILGAIKSAPAANKILTPSGIMGAMELYSSYEKIKDAKGSVSAVDALPLALQGFDYLKAQGITLDDVEQLAKAAAPLVK